MKKHTFREHYYDCERVMYNNQTMPEDRQMAIMVAYERWLNNRSLMSEEQLDDLVKFAQKSVPGV